MFLHSSVMMQKVFTGLCFHSKIKNIIFEALKMASEQHFPSPAAFTYRSMHILNPVPHIPRTGHRVSAKLQPSVIAMPVEITEL